MDKRIRETISIYHSGVAFTHRGEVSTHIDGEFTSSVETKEDGTRVITLVPIDTKATKEKIKAITEKILEALGESKSKAMRSLLLDHLKEYWDDDIEDMYKRIVVREEPIKMREGCFKVIIGDGRKRGHRELQLVE